MRLINWVNSRWNNFIFLIHDITTRMGIGHTSVWLFDNMTWTLPEKWQLVAGKTHEQYLLEHELYIARHQVQYYANLAYEYQWIILDAMDPVNDTEEVVNKDLKEKEKV